MKRLTIFMTVLLVWLQAGLASAQTPPTEKFFALPLAGYSSEFGFGLGATAAWLNIDDTTWQASAVAYVGTLYALNFINLDLLNRHLFDFLYLDVGGSYYQNYRAFFYGLGNYSSFSNEVQFSNLRQSAYGKLGIRPLQYLVVGASINQGTMAIDRGADPTLPQFLDQYSTLPSPSGLTTTFTGAFISYDSRLPETAPQEGNLLLAILEQSQPFGNETLDEQHFEFIGENFLQIFETDLILVSHMKYERTWGDSVPFFLQAPIGGPDTLRGFDVSRFIDAGAITFDFEPRWTFWSPNGSFIKRFELSAAFETGKVFNEGLWPTLDGFHIDEDFGLTAVMTDDLPLRFDVGISDETTLLYLNLFYPF